MKGPSCNQHPERNSAMSISSISQRTAIPLQAAAQPPAAKTPPAATPASEESTESAASRLAEANGGVNKLV